MQALSSVQVHGTGEVVSLRTDGESAVVCIGDGEGLILVTNEESVVGCMEQWEGDNGGMWR